jgi:hypothetical protein
MKKVMPYSRFFTLIPDKERALRRRAICKKYIFQNPTCR